MPITTGSAPKALRPSKPRKPKKMSTKVKKPKAVSPLNGGKKETLLEKLLKQK
jgi:hypothetical protein